MVKIETRPFELSEDLAHINQFLSARSLPQIHPNGVPEIGLIAENESGPIAAAFIRRCEGNVGMIDGLVTDPKAPSLDRHHAIDLLVHRLLTIARHLGITRIFAFSTDVGTLERSEKHGFKKTQFAVISKTL